jgi:hypothetical protein
MDRLCGLVFRIPGYRSRDPVFDSRRYQIFWEVVCLESGALSLVSITEELLERKSRGSGCRKPRLTAVRIRFADHAIPSIRTNFADNWRSLDRYSLRTKATEFSFSSLWCHADVWRNGGTHHLFCNSTLDPGRWWAPAQAALPESVWTPNPCQKSNVVCSYSNPSLHRLSLQSWWRWWWWRQHNFCTNCRLCDNIYGEFGRLT